MGIGEYPFDSMKNLTDQKLSIWIHIKTIQKAIDSYRISPERMQFPRRLKNANRGRAFAPSIFHS